MRVFGLIGYPLGHSFSQQYFTDKFLKEGITDCRFDVFSIESISLFPEILKNTPHLEGICVTIPYKEKVIEYVSILSDEVKAIGATNSLHITNNFIIAYNTDIAGFRESFCKKLKPHHKKALVLGTGGAAKAVQYVLQQLHIDYLVISRSKDFKEGQLSYDKVDPDMLEEYTVIINCSPAGMYPHQNSLPDLPYQAITPEHYLFDLVYKPASTLFLQEGQKRGAAVQNGFEMLVLQAEASWKIWNEGR